MSDETGNENEGKIIVDARGTVKRVSPPESKAEEKVPEAEGVVRDLAEKAATAVAGGLVAEGFDAIQNVAERERVVRTISRREREYEGDKFKDLTYGELRVVLATGQNEGKKLGLEEMEAARNSRRTRYREAASYGVMTGVGGTLRSKLVEADWTDYPAKIAEAAKTAEDEAMGKYEYRYNPRIQGVVSDAVSRTELLVRLDGYRGLTDLNNPKNIAKLRQLKIGDINKEVGALEARISDEVLWDPEGGRYAGLVNQETPKQKEERLEGEKAEAQRQHELKLAQLKAEAEARARAETGAGLGMRDALTVLQDAIEKQREVGIEDDKILETSEFDEDFLEAHNLPKYIYFLRGFKMIRRDMRTALKLASEVGEFTGLDTGNFLLAFIEQKEKEKGESLTDEEKRTYTEAGLKSFKELAEGIVPLLGVRKRNTGTFASLAGNPKLTDPKLQAGALITAGFNLKDTFKAFSSDVEAKKALSTWLALFGAQMEGLGAEATTFVERYKGQVEQMMAKNHKELTRDVAVARMDGVAEQMVADLGVDKGQVALMRELANLLVPGPDMQGYRKLLKDHPVLRLDLKELAARPILEKIRYGGQPRFLSEGLKTREEEDIRWDKKEEGVEEWVSQGGVDELFARVAKLDSGNIQLQYKTLKDLQDNMDDIGNYQKGKDNFPDTPKRREEIAKLAEGLGGGDIPKIMTATVEAIKRLPVHAGRGINAEAGKLSFLQRERDILSEIRNDIFNVVKGFFDITPLGLILRLVRRLRR